MFLCSICVYIILRVCTAVDCSRFLSSTMRASLSLRRLFVSWSSRLLLPWSTTVLPAPADDCRQECIKAERRQKPKLYSPCRTCSLCLHFFCYFLNLKRNFHICIIFKHQMVQDSLILCCKTLASFLQSR